MPPRLSASLRTPCARMPYDRSLSVDIACPCGFDLDQTQQRSNAMDDCGMTIQPRDGVNPEEGIREYGDVDFADPVNNKYPVDTPEHIHAAWSYIHHQRDAAFYSP